MKDIIDKLAEIHDASDEDMVRLLTMPDTDDVDYLALKARETREQYYGKDVYLRGLVEFTNICKNDCYYCGIRRSNSNADRYRLSEADILDCCDRGYELGFRTFVLQGGEDPYFTDDVMVPIVEQIRKRHPDCAITLSLGERSYESYKGLFDAGADRYLLRHETADAVHYAKLHPKDMSFDHRMECLKQLREIGYQVGCGMMVGSPYQEISHLITDLRFLKKFNPDMVGIGPFIPHQDTPFKDESLCDSLMWKNGGFSTPTAQGRNGEDESAGKVELTLRLLSIIRLLLPSVLLPATTALGTIDPTGREQGLLAGANVVMPNLSPTDVRGKYLLYDNKICTGEEAAECVRCLSLRIEKTGYKVVVDRGDRKPSS